MHHPHHLISVPVDAAMDWYFWFVAHQEGFCLTFADLVLSNSRYTKQILHHYMRSELPTYKSDLLYPCAELIPIDSKKINKSDSHVFTAMGRFWPMKHTDLLVDAVLHLRRTLSPNEWSKIRLQFAGSVDNLLPYSSLFFKKLQNIVYKENLAEITTFLANISDEKKHEILRNSTAIIFTPRREHFGIVPVESLLSGARIVAHDAAGPKETLVCAPEKAILVKWYSPVSFADAMVEMMEAGRPRDENPTKLLKQMKSFSFDSFSVFFLESLAWLE